MKCAKTVKKRVSRYEGKRNRFKIYVEFSRKEWVRFQFTCNLVVSGFEARLLFDREPPTRFVLVNK